MGTGAGGGDVKLLPAREPQRLLVRTALIALAYFISSLIGVALLFQPHNIANFWPPSGLLLGVLLISRRRTWPLILLTIIPANLMANLLGGKSLHVSIAFALVNALEGLVGAGLLVRYCGGRPTLTQVKEVLGLVVLGGLVSPILTATLGAVVVVVGIGVSSFRNVWAAWWATDVLGILLVTPVILTWSTTGTIVWKAPQPSRIAEAAFLCTAMALLTVFVFGATPTSLLLSLAYLTFPFLLGAAWRFGPQGASTAALGLALVAVWATAHGYGPFALAGVSVGQRVLAAQAFVGVSILTALVIAAALAERMQAERALHGQNTLVRLLQVVASAANQASTIEEAMQICLDQVCAHTGWPVGHVYYTAGEATDRLVPSSIWSLKSAERFETFRQVTESTPLAWGIGLPGRVFASGKPAWIIDVTKDANFPRAQLTSDIGVRAGFGFPVLVGKEVVAVLEFFSDETAEPDEALLDVMAHIGTQLGRVFERIRAEEALRASELRFRSVVESASDGMIIADSAGTIMAWNKSAQTIFGYGAEEALGQPLTLLMPGRYRDAHRQGLERLRSTGKPRVVGRTVELHGLRKDGSEFPLELSLSSWKAGEHTFFSGIIRDITERKRAEEEIRRLNEALAQRVMALDASNKELEAFSHSISHNLRAPLRALAGFSGILLEEHAPQLTDEVQHYLQRIQHNAQNMGRMIDDLLALIYISRQPVNLQTLSPARLVEQALDELHSAQQGRRISMTIGDLPVCRADPTLLRQVFVNLLSNALKFTRQREVARIEIGCRQDEALGERVYFVKDNGLGFNMQYVGKLFGVFERLHPTQDYEGTGIGLAIVQRIIRRHGGQIWAEAAVNQGATFYFTLAEDPSHR